MLQLHHFLLGWFCLLFYKPLSWRTFKQIKLSATALYSWVTVVPSAFFSPLFLISGSNEAYVIAWTFPCSIYWYCNRISASAWVVLFFSILYILQQVEKQWVLIRVWKEPLFGSEHLDKVISVVQTLPPSCFPPFALYLFPICHSFSIWIVVPFSPPFFLF